MSVSINSVINGVNDVSFSKDANGNPIGLVNPVSTAPIPLNQNSLFNFNENNYRKSRAAFNKVRAGSANASIVFIGDSTEMGKGSPTAGSTVGSRATSPSVRIASILTSTVMPTNSNTFVSDNNTGDITALKAYDNRIATTGATNVWFGTSTLFGACFRFPNAASTLTLTANTACDTWEITYLDNSTAQFSWQIGVGAITTITQANTGTLVKATVTATAATTLNLAWVAAGTVGIMHVKAYNAATKELSVFDAGINGGDSASFINSAFYYSALNHLKTIAPDLTVIRLGINDYNPATPVAPATFSTNIQTIITAAQLSGDVILATPIPAQDTATMTLAGQQAYSDAIYSLAIANNLAVVDIWRRLGSYPISQALYYSDIAGHQNTVGY